MRIELNDLISGQEVSLIVKLCFPHGDPGNRACLRASVSSDDQTAFVTQTVTLNGEHSSDVDGDALAVAWTIVSAPNGTSAVLANLHARGEIVVGQEIVAEGIAGGLFRGKVLETTTIGGRPAVISEVTGTAAAPR